MVSWQISTQLQVQIHLNFQNSLVQPPLARVVARWRSIILPFRFVLLKFLESIAINCLDLDGAHSFWKTGSDLISKIKAATKCNASVAWLWLGGSVGRPWDCAAIRTCLATFVFWVFMHFIAFYYCQWSLKVFPYCFLGIVFAAKDIALRRWLRRYFVRSGLVRKDRLCCFVPDGGHPDTVVVRNWTELLGGLRKLGSSGHISTKAVVKYVPRQSWPCFLGGDAWRRNCKAYYLNKYNYIQ